jgi:hypothetical protein
MYNDRDGGDSGWGNGYDTSIEKASSKAYGGKNRENVQVICIGDQGLANGLTISLGYSTEPANFV